MNNSEISVCIPVFNGHSTIRQTIESVLNQQYTNFEIVIVDNASTDNTLEIINSFKDPRIRLISNPFTIPASENWTKCVALARGHWTKLLCADDLLEPTALSDSMNAIESHPSAVAVIGSRNVINEIGTEVLASRNLYPEPKLLGHKQIIDLAISSGTNPLGESLCIMWQSWITSSVGEFSKVWNYYIDLDYWFRLSVFGDLLVIPNKVGSFRISSSTWTSRLGLSAIIEAKDFYLKHEFFSEVNPVRRFMAVVKASIRVVARKIFIAVRSN